MTSTNNSFSHSFYDVITDVLLTMEAGAIVIAFWTFLIGMFLMHLNFPTAPLSMQYFAAAVISCIVLHFANRIITKPGKTE